MTKLGQRIVVEHVLEAGQDLGIEPGTGHMVMWENPNGVADVAIQFLQTTA